MRLNEFTEQNVEEGQQGMSRAAKGHEKYGKAGMAALAKAGREGASDEQLDKIRDRHDKYDESVNQGVAEVAGAQKCWPGHRKVGTQAGTGKNAGKRVNNCEKIKEDDIEESGLQYHTGVKKHGKGTLPESEEEKKSFKVTYTNPKTEENKVVKIKAYNKDEVLDYCVSKGYNDVSVKEIASEGYRVVPGYDKEKYQERPGLEGPFHTKSGKVVYYDKKEGSYYDPDSDMFISYEDWQAMNEAGFGGATGRASWDSNMPGYQGDYGGAENWGHREREDDEHNEIDRRQEQQAVSGPWYITKDGKLVKDKEGQPYQFVGKAAATKAAQTMMAKPFNQGKKFMLTTKGA